MNVLETTMNFEEEEKENKKSRKILRWAGWSAFALFCLIVFTLLKLPEARIKVLVEDSITGMLKSQRISYTARESELSLGLGITYSLKDVTVNLPGQPTPVKFDSVTIEPSLLPLLWGKLSSELELKMGEGKLVSEFSIPAKLTSKQPPHFDLDFSAEKIDLAKFGFLSQFGGLKGVLLLEGKGSLKGSLADPKTLDGNIDLRSRRIQLPSQSLMGFMIPELKISDSVADLSIRKGNVKFTKLKIGKTKGQDDLIANVQGNIELNRILDYSRADLVAAFEFSEKVKKALPLIDTLLQPAKRKDGAYAYQLKGPINGLFPTPMPNMN